jgi:hypothetical protein
MPCTWHERELIPVSKGKTISTPDLHSRKLMKDTGRPLGAANVIAPK